MRPQSRDLAPVALGGGAVCSLAGGRAGGLFVVTLVLILVLVGRSRPAARVVVTVLAIIGFGVGAHRLDELAADPLAPLVGTRVVGMEAIIEEPWRGSGRTRLAIARLTQPIEGPVLIRAALADPPPRGTVVVLDGMATRPRGPDGDFDERAWLSRFGVHVVIRADHVDVRGQRGGLQGLADRARLVALDPIERTGTDDPSALVAGLVYGVQSGISPAAITDMRRSGLAHLLAVSGGNVALLVTLMLLLVWLAGGSRRTGLLISIVAIAVYAAIVGASPSVGRAAMAGVAACVAWLSSRPRDAWRALALGFAILAMLNPRTVYDPGFQLSFAAVAAILLVALRWQRALAGTPVPRALAAGFAVTAAATVATAPISWWHFGRASLIGAVPANLVAMPAVPLVLWLGLGASLIYPLAPALGVALAELARVPAWWVLQTATWGAALDRSVPWPVGLVLALAIVCAGVWVIRRRSGAAVGSAHGRRRRPRARLPDRG